MIQLNCEPLPLWLKVPLLTMWGIGVVILIAVVIGMVRDEVRQRGMWK
jgi:hypothetical protein